MNKKITLLRIAEIGHPVIRKVCEPVKNPLSFDIQRLIDNMIATCKEQGGIGIAASQVYRLVRVIIIASAPGPVYPNAPVMRPFAAINPKLKRASPKSVRGWEGCMSIPGIRAQVARSAWIDVEYLDRKGKFVERRLAGLPARIFLHELDHLDGISFLDRADLKTLSTHSEYMKMLGRIKKK